ncbi:phosphotransferase family protein [Streptomyces sp. HD]|uniref:phosphotransferase family protein n=1 Tax=Streptomyces sp. HD TaxID=3020892 RepID=UPI00233148A8|nr:aminoglycoside phosphotransferase family protein [Streptomyces sp. HD]MDC0770234.1 aminoglycoside phosphotransferase family protein [Streptomyces sp. HD]
MSPQLSRRTHRRLVRLLAEARRRSPGGTVVIGHHNSNTVLPLGQPLAFLLGAGSGRALAKFRTPMETIEVVPRIWRRESQVLDAVRIRLGADTPRCLVDHDNWSLHTHVPGRVLSDVAAEGTVGADRLAALAEFFAALAEVPLDGLSPPPADWPEHGDSQGFLAWQARFTGEHVHRANQGRFGELFEAVGIPEDAMERFLDSARPLTSRPFVLLHTDVHRANIVLSPGPGGERPVVIDWELAMIGDPLHDLATHLVRMNYGRTEHEQMVQLWADAMLRAGHAELTTGMRHDLPVYLALEYAQSVFADVMRAAAGLPERPTDLHFAVAARQVCRAVRRAWAALCLVDEPPDERTAEEALRRWYASDGRVSMGRHRNRNAGQNDLKGKNLRGSHPGNGAVAERLERHGC